MVRCSTLGFVKFNIYFLPQWSAQLSATSDWPEPLHAPCLATRDPTAGSPHPSHPSVSFSHSMIPIIDCKLTVQHSPFTFIIIYRYMRFLQVITSFNIAEKVLGPIFLHILLIFITQVCEISIPFLDPHPWKIIPSVWGNLIKISPFISLFVCFCRSWKDLTQPRSRHVLVTSCRDLFNL